MTPHAKDAQDNLEDLLFCFLKPIVLLHAV